MVNESVKVGKYFLTYVKKLKDGGYGSIWKVKNAQTHEIYALKIQSIQTPHMERVAMAELETLVWL
jgi:serine/threonine protein kinase